MLDFLSLFGLLAIENPVLAVHSFPSENFARRGKEFRKFWRQLRIRCRRGYRVTGLCARIGLVRAT